MPDPSQPLFRLQNLRQTYAGRTVLSVERLELHPGEVLAVVGPSGAGKSTLLRLLNFLESPAGGTITFLGKDYGPGQQPPVEERRAVTMVFQRPMLLNRSVRANVEYGLRLRRQKDGAAAVQSALEEVGLARLADCAARTLSGGEAQRVALARAVVLHPQVLLLDEPTANLDPYNVGLIENIITRLNRAYGVTVVLVTHNVFQAKRLASRAALLLDGKVVESAAADSFFNHPADPRTAAFVRGEMIY